MKAANEAPRQPERGREEPVFDEHEEWPEMLKGCESKRAVLDPRGEAAHRFASLRTVRREP